jgi:hypothetical protein
MKQFNEGEQYTVEVPNEAHITLEMKGLDAILPCLLNRRWVLVKAPQSSSGFITSDHPVCLIWSVPNRLPPGFGIKGTEVIFPLSSRLALIGAFEIDDGEYDASDAFVAEINGVVIAYATRQVYARDQNFHYQPEPNAEPRKASRLISEPTFKAAEDDQEQ